LWFEIKRQKISLPLLPYSRYRGCALNSSWTRGHLLSGNGARPLSREWSRLLAGIMFRKDYRHSSQYLAVTPPREHTRPLSRECGIAYSVCARHERKATHGGCWFNARLFSSLNFFFVSSLSDTLEMSKKVISLAGDYPSILCWRSGNKAMSLCKCLPLGGFPYKRFTGSAATSQASCGCLNKQPALAPHVPHGPIRNQSPGYSITERDQARHSQNGA
jgi:hypothetical protein